MGKFSEALEALQALGEVLRDATCKVNRINVAVGEISARPQSARVALGDVLEEKAELHERVALVRVALDEVLLDVAVAARQWLEVVERRVAMSEEELERLHERFRENALEAANARLGQLYDRLEVMHEQGATELDDLLEGIANEEDTIELLDRQIEFDRRVAATEERLIAAEEDETELNELLEEIGVGRD